MVARYLTTQAIRLYFIVMYRLLISRFEPESDREFLLSVMTGNRAERERSRTRVGWIVLRQY